MKRLLLPMIALLASHATLAADGQITFVGAIVEPSCDYAVTRSVSLNCTREGIKKSETLQVNQATRKLPYALGTAQITRQRGLNFLMVEYN